MPYASFQASNPKVGIADAKQNCMIDKHSITIGRPSQHLVSFGLHLHEIAAKLRKVIRIEIPIGYQDETGFHHGVAPAEKRMKWPPVG